MPLYPNLSLDYPQRQPRNKLKDNKPWHARKKTAILPGIVSRTAPRAKWILPPSRYDHAHLTVATSLVHELCTSKEREWRKRAAERLTCQIMGGGVVVSLHSQRGWKWFSEMKSSTPALFLTLCLERLLRPRPGSSVFASRSDSHGQTASV